MNSRQSISNFYDDFSTLKKKGGSNERHFYMQEKLLRLGLNSESNVLELGCGIGMITVLMNKIVKKGKIIAVDISPKSIEIAKQQLPKVEFHVGDITTFRRDNLVYDFVALFDVLEHIPLEFHSCLFKNVASHMTTKTKCLINIPNPDYLDYIRKESPDMLQIVDNSLQIGDIIKEATDNGLDLIFFEKYNLWHKYESEFMIFELNNFNVEEAQPPKQSLVRRIQNKLEIYW